MPLLKRLTLDGYFYRGHLVPKGFGENLLDCYLPQIDVKLGLLDLLVFVAAVDDQLELSLQ